MTENSLPNVSTAILNPNPSIREIKDMYKYASKVLNVPRIDIARATHKSGPNSLANTAPKVKERFGFSSEEVAIREFGTAQDIASNTITMVIETLGLDPNQFGQRTEAQIDEGSICDAMKWLDHRKKPRLESNRTFMGFDNGVTPKLRFEERRKLFLTDIALRLLKQGIQDNRGNILSEIQELLDRKVYQGPVGSDDLITHTLHVDKTGKVTKNNKDKKVEFSNRMRQVWIKGHKKFVQTDFDKKKYESQILKLLCDYAPYINETNDIVYPEFDPVGINNKGELNIHDGSRFRFILDGDKNELEHFSDQIISIKDNEKHIVFDNAILSPQKKDRGQVDTWKIRYKAWYKGVPVEILFYDVAGYYNSTHQFGELDTKSGIYTGADHRLYEIRRLLKILELLFPYEIYKKNEAQTHEQYSKQLLKYVSRMSTRVVEQLKLKEI